MSDFANNYWSNAFRYLGRSALHGMRKAVNYTAKGLGLPVATQFLAGTPNMSGRHRSTLSMHQGPWSSLYNQVDNSDNPAVSYYTNVNKKNSSIATEIDKIIPPNYKGDTQQVNVWKNQAEPLGIAGFATLTSVLAPQALRRLPHAGKAITRVWNNAHRFGSYDGSSYLSR
jgi:hypothetical protein